MSKSRSSVILALALAGVAIMVLGSALVVARPLPEELQAVRAATARFNSVTQAERAGYARTPECVASPAGTMGIHFEHAGLMADDDLDPLAPEILVYLPTDDGLKLVAVEYWKAAELDGTGQPTGTDQPSLFGQRFQGPMPGHHPAMPTHYDLHVWIWADNPAGMFAQFNPALRCPTH